MNGDVLNSWKEIAAYMGRGVRTVQRWEQELGLPVRRPRGKERSAVLALKSDLDRWLHNTPQGAMAKEAMPATTSKTDRQIKLQLNTEQLLERTQEIIERSTRMREAVKVALNLTSRLRREQMESIRSRQARAQDQRLLLARAGELTRQIRQCGGGDPTGQRQLIEIPVSPAKAAKA